MTGRRDSARGRAGGKVIILGEHAVVHGAKAIAASLPDRTAVEAAWTGGPDSLAVEPWGVVSRVGGGGIADRALEELLRALGAPLDGIALAGATTLPPRAGLGASASIAAAAARAIASLVGGDPSDAALYAAVQASERVYHGNPSGVDAAAVLGEGLLCFSRDGGIVPIAGAVPELVVAHSGEGGDTRVTVEAFAARLAAAPGEGARRLGAIADVVERGLQALAGGNMDALGALMDEDHAQLSWFGVSTPALDRACAVARGAGALGAKLTGGGGGGCAIALARPGDRSAVARALEAAGFAVVPT